MRDVRDIVRRVVGPFPRHCSGCGMQPGDRYLATPLIGAGVTRMRPPVGGSRVLDEIVAFDRAEAEYANVTQTNMVAVSSFCGLQGLLLGYDVVRQPLLPHPLAPGAFDARPLFEATRALYGTVRERRFPIAPGQQVLCAYKCVRLPGPCLLYGAMAVAIPADRGRDADLFMEDHGAIVAGEEMGGLGLEGAVLARLVDAVREVGQNLRVEYDRVFLGFRPLPVASGELGCVLTAAPYVHLARLAVPEGKPELLSEMSLPEWEEATASHY